MSYRHTMEAALESLREIEDLLRGFRDEDAIPSIEIDLGLQKLRNVYELLLMMKAPAEAPPQEKKAEVPPAPPSPPSPPVSPVTEPLPQAAVSVPDGQLEKKAPTPAGDNGKEQILSDRFRGRATLHETLHETMGKEAGTLGTAKPVSNLMKAIAINDRFTFVRELFNNDARAFESAIDALNEAASFNDAYNYMMRHFSWDMDSAAVQQLLEIIRRKYITSRHE